MPVWVLWDEGTSEKDKKWFGKPLAPGRRSPKGLDIDGVAAYLEGMKIASLTVLGGIDKAISDWWWLGQGLEVAIRDGYAIQTVRRDSQVGWFSVVADSAVAGWGPSWLGLESDWGLQL
jgi:hypothetical protein